MSTQTPVKQVPLPQPKPQIVSQPQSTPTQGIQQTKNYDMFKKHDSNRPINETKVRSLMDAITESNRLHLKPIIVDDKMRVIDGQHRLEAAKRLEVAIYYILDKELKDKDMAIFNANQSAWKLAEYHNFFVTQGHPEYRKLEEFTKRHKMSLQEYMKLDNFGRKSVNSNNFRHGKFIMPTDEEQKGKLNIWNFAKELFSFIGKRRSDIPQVLKSVNFQRALISFLKRDDVSFQEFKNKIEMKIDIMGARSGMGGYYQMFLEIYNFRRKDPIA